MPKHVTHIIFSTCQLEHNALFRKTSLLLRFHRRVLVWTPPPLPPFGKFQLSFILSIKKNFGIWDPTPTSGISNDLPVLGYGYFWNCTCNDRHFWLQLRTENKASLYSLINYIYLRPCTVEQYLLTDQKNLRARVCSLILCKQALEPLDIQVNVSR